MLFDFGPIVISGTPGLPESPVAYAPRRTVLDKLLVDAAAEAGAEIREGFNVEDVVIEDGTVVGIRGHAVGRRVGDRARPDRDRSRRDQFDGREVRAAGDVRREAQTAVRLLRLLERVADERHVRDLYPAQSGLRGDPHQRRSDPGDRSAGRTRSSPPTRPTCRATTSGPSPWRRHSPIGSRAPPRRVVSSDPPMPNFFRKPYGPGWALVGDAGYNRDFITARGSPTPSATPTCAQPRSTPGCPASATGRGDERLPADPRRQGACRCTS